MPEPRSFAEHFLIAMPAMDDPNFVRSVTLVCQHDEGGAMGLVINHPADVRFGELLDQLRLAHGDAALAERLVLDGGPVQPDRGFVLHDDPRPWDSSLRLRNGLAVTTSRDILEAIARGEGPANWLLALGYAGWDAGQLEAEMAANSWLTVPADAGLVFDVPVEARWRAAAGRLGVDLDRLADYAGHA